MTRLQINNIDLEYVDKLKCLCVTLNRRLNIKLHYNDILSKLRKSKLRKIVNTFTALTIYKSHILSFVEYGGMFTKCLPQNLKTKIQRLQNRCLREVYRADRYTRNFVLHKKAKLLLLRYRRKMSVCNLMYKRIESDPTIVSVPRREGTRSQHHLNIVVPTPYKESFKRTVSYSGPTMWNNLPNSIKTCNNLAEFKRKLKKYLYDSFCQDGFV